MIFLLCVLCFSGLVFGQGGQSADKLVDSFLTTVLGKINHKNLDKVKISNLHFHYSTRKIPGRLDCDHGTARSLLSLRKTGAVKVTRTNDSVNITIPLQMGTLQYHFMFCRYNLRNFFHAMDNVTITARSNSIELKLTVIKNRGICRARASKIKFLKVSNMRIKVNNFLPKDLKGELGRPFIDYMKKVTNQISEKYQFAISLAFTQRPFCDIFDQL
nr:uncharacterized protein LOC112210406 [Halyomorpha halys]